MNNRGSVIVLANEAAVCAVQAGASLRFQVDGVCNGFLLRLGWHEPSTIGVAVQFASRCDNQAAFFSCVHCHSSLLYGVYLRVIYHREQRRQYPLGKYLTYIPSRCILEIMAKIQIWGWQCERCEHKWVPREESTNEPQVCPKCKSPYWNRPRKAEKDEKSTRASKMRRRNA